MFHFNVNKPPVYRDPVTTGAKANVKAENVHVSMFSFLRIGKF